MNLISINNSGESIEKTVALVYGSMLYNSSYYEQFTSIVVFYGNNLPKKKKNLPAHGTIDSLLCNHHGKSWNPCKNGIADILTNRNEIIDSINTNGYVSNRVADKLRCNTNRYLNVIKKMPFDSIYPDFANKLLCTIKSIYQNVDFKKIDLFHILDNNLDLVVLNRWMPIKIYLLAPNGDLGVVDFSTRSYKDKMHRVKFLRQCPSLSGNILMFLLSLPLSVPNFKSPIIGYRKMQRNRRRSYDIGMDYIFNHSDIEGVIIEPRNHLILNYFNNLPNTSNEEDRANAVMTKAFSEFCDKYMVSQ